MSPHVCCETAKHSRSGCRRVGEDIVLCLTRSSRARSREFVFGLGHPKYAGACDWVAAHVPPQVIKLADVACGVGNVLQNKGGIGAFVRVDRTTFLFVTAHLAAHQVRRSCSRSRADALPTLWKSRPDFPPEEGLAPRTASFLLDGEKNRSVGIMNMVLLPLLTLIWVLPGVFKD